METDFDGFVAARILGERGARFVAQRFDFSDYISGLENTFYGLCSKPEERIQVSA